MRARLVATVLVALLAGGALAGCAASLGIGPRECDYGAGFFAERRGWVVEEVAPEAAPRALATTSPGEFALDLNVTLEPGERVVRGAYGPPIQTGQVHLSITPVDGGRLRAGVAWCGEGEPGLSCDSAAEDGGIAGEGHGFGFSEGVARGSCVYSMTFNGGVFGRRDVLRWQVSVEEGQGFRVVATPA